MTKILASFFTLFLVIGSLSASNAHAQANSGNIPQFMPIGSWLVSPAQIQGPRGLNNIKLPCMMSVTYDNGYNVRLSGGDKQFLAMAIDFRQNVFKQGRKYPATIGADNGFSQATQATAFSDSVLIFNLRKLSGFYAAIQNANSMTLDIDGNSFQFSLGSFSDGAAQLEGCYSGKPANKNQQQVVNNLEDQVWGDKVSPVSTPASQPRRVKPEQDIWTASAGDDMRTTIELWAQRAGIDVDWQASRNGQVTSDIRVEGSFEEAVQSLMAQNSVLMGVEANMMGANTQTALNAPQELIPTRMSGGQANTGAPHNMGMDGGSHTGAGKWSAPLGANLQKVLEIWSEQAGVSVLWQSHIGFKVKRGVNANGDYASALQSLLSQFEGDKMRPAAQLNSDPVTGQRILLVESTRVQ